MNTMPSSALLCASALLIVAASAGACCPNSGPSPEKEPSAPSASVSASAAPSASVESPSPKKLPTLAPEPFAGTKDMTVDFYAIEGAFVVVDGMRVGRIVDEGVDWFGKLPETNAWLGGSQINGVQGYWPDGVDVVYSSMNGRASQPSIYPLTGKGAQVTFAPGGGAGWVSGSGRLGKTTIVGGWDFTAGYRFETVRGPGLVIKPIKADVAGCTEEEIQRQFGVERAVAVGVRALAVTEKGTLVTVGALCEREKSPVAEVWDAPGKSRIVDLTPFIKQMGYFPQMLVGRGDDLWVATSPVLHYSAGKFEALPALERPLRSLFVSPAGKLHGISGRTIYRFDEGQWTAVANLPWPMWFRTIAMDAQGVTWVSYGKGVARLRENTGVDVEGGCTTPFVYLYEVSWKNEPKYTYPTTRKALSTFPEVGEITLMEYWEGSRILGIQVKSKEQGEAVMAHVKANMKDEHPELICYAPKKPRVIEMKGGK